MATIPKVFAKETGASSQLNERLSIDVEDGFYWHPAGPLGITETHPVLINEVAGRENMELFETTFYERRSGEPDGSHMQMALSKDAGRAYAIYVDGPTDEVTNVVWFHCAPDPEEVATLFYELLKQADILY